jgi:hypothetical protein
MSYGSDKIPIASRKPPIFRDMQIKNLTVDGAPAAILITGLEDSLVSNIRFENVAISSLKGVIASNATGLVFDSVKIAPSAGPEFDFDNVSQSLIRNAGGPPAGRPFLKVKGKASAGIRIEGSNIPEDAVEIGADAPANAVSMP